MMNPLSVSWWVNITVNTLAVLAVLYVLKKASKKYNIPVLSQLTEEA